MILLFAKVDDSCRTLKDYILKTKNPFLVLTRAALYAILFTVKSTNSVIKELYAYETVENNRIKSSAVSR